MIAEFTFGYETIVADETEVIDGKSVIKNTIMKISKENYKKLREAIQDLPEDPTVNRITYWTKYIADIDYVLQYVDRIEVIRPIRMVGSYEKLLCLADRVIGNLQDLEKRNDQLFNKRVEVHVPGNSLLKINEVDFLKDACTDELNKLIDEGWRIVAVCPQPDQRRPDYIIGREV